MTVLNILLEPRRVCLAMDTLVTRGGLPSALTSKILPLPHLNGVICGTGSLGLLLEWFVHVETAIAARDLLQIGGAAAEELRRLGRRYGLTREAPATIYHIGLDARLGRFRGVAFRSGAAFAPEELAEGWHLQPPAPGPAPASLPADLIALIERQKADDRRLPPADRVGIGGDIHFLVMTPGQFNLFHCHRFGDYDADYAAVRDALA